MKTSAPKISVVIPVFCSENILETLFVELKKVLNALDDSWEIIMVDDASTDGTYAKLRALREKDRRVKLVRFSRNQGQHHALVCGLQRATGRYVITIDDDMQNPPSEIPKFIEKLEEGYDLVIGRIAGSKQHGHSRNMGSRLIQRLVSGILKKPKNLSLSSFRGMNQDVAKRIGSYKGAHPYLPALLLESTSTENICNIAVKHDPRPSGTSNYTLRKLFKLASYLLINHSKWPLRCVAIWGFFVSILSFGYALYIALSVMMHGSTVAGWPSLAVLVSFLSGNILLSIGILGEYIGRLVESTSQNRQFPICEEHLE